MSERDDYVGKCALFPLLPGLPEFLTKGIVNKDAGVSRMMAAYVAYRSAGGAGDLVLYGEGRIQNC